MNLRVVIATCKNLQEGNIKQKSKASILIVLAEISEEKTKKQRYFFVSKTIIEFIQTTKILMIDQLLSLGFTQSQETQKTIFIAAMLVSQKKEIIKILLLRVLQHGRHDVR